MGGEIPFLCGFPQTADRSVQPLECYLNSLRTARGFASSPLQPIKIEIDFCFSAREMSMVVNACVRFWSVSAFSNHQNCVDKCHWAAINAHHGMLILFSKTGAVIFTSTFMQEWRMVRRLETRRLMFEGPNSLNLMFSSELELDAFIECLKFKFWIDSPDHRSCLIPSAESVYSEDDASMLLLGQDPSDHDQDRVSKISQRVITVNQEDKSTVGWRCLGALCLCLYNLQVIEIAQVILGIDEIDSMSCISSCLSLRVLRMSHVSFAGQARVEKLCHALSSCPSFKTLQLPGTKLSLRSVHHWAKLFVCLAEIDLTNCGLSSEHLSRINEAIPSTGCQALRILKLAENQHTPPDELCRFLDCLLGPSLVIFELEELDVWNVPDPSDNAAFSRLFALFASKFTNLRCLKINSTTFTPFVQQDDFSQSSELQRLTSKWDYDSDDEDDKHARDIIVNRLREESSRNIDKMQQTEKQSLEMNSATFGQFSDALQKMIFLKELHASRAFVSSKTAESIASHPSLIHVYASGGLEHGICGRCGEPGCAVASKDNSPHALEVRKICACTIFVDLNQNPVFTFIEREELLILGFRFLRLQPTHCLDVRFHHADQDAVRFLDQLLTHDLRDCSLNIIGVGNLKSGKVIEARLPKALHHCTQLNALLINSEALEVLVEPPVNVFQEGARHVVTYFRSQLSRNESVKVNFVGLGEGGKTSLIKALQQGHAQVIDVDNRTIGVDVQDWHADDALILKTWDFAGQKVYDQVNQLFLSHRAINIMVWRLLPRVPLKKLGKHHTCSNPKCKRDFLPPLHGGMQGHAQGSCGTRKCISGQCHLPYKDEPYTGKVYQASGQSLVHLECIKPILRTQVIDWLRRFQCNVNCAYIIPVATHCGGQYPDDIKTQQTLMGNILKDALEDVQTPIEAMIEPAKSLIQKLQKDKKKLNDRLKWKETDPVNDIEKKIISLEKQITFHKAFLKPWEARLMRCPQIYKMGQKSMMLDSISGQGIEIAKRKLIKATKRMDFYGEPIPLAYQNILTRLKEHSAIVPYLELYKVKEMARSCFLNEEADIEGPTGVVAALRYWHDCGELIFLQQKSDVVFLDPRFLIDLVKCLVTHEHPVSSDRVTWLLTRRLKEGKLVPELVPHIWAGRSSEDLSFILQLLEACRIIIPSHSAPDTHNDMEGYDWQTFNGTWFVPCKMQEGKALVKASSTFFAHRLSHFSFEFPCFPDGAFATFAGLCKKHVSRILLTRDCAILSLRGKQSLIQLYQLSDSDTRHKVGPVSRIVLACSDPDLMTNLVKVIDEFLNIYPGLFQLGSSYQMKHEVASASEFSSNNFKKNFVILYADLVKRELIKTSSRPRPGDFLPEDLDQYVDFTSSSFQKAFFELHSEWIFRHIENSLSRIAAKKMKILSLSQKEVKISVVEPSQVDLLEMSKNDQVFESLFKEFYDTNGVNIDIALKARPPTNVSPAWARDISDDDSSDGIKITAARDRERNMKP